MQCPRCDGNNSNENRYCESCGSQLCLYCRKCSHKNSATAFYCGSCGDTLDRGELSDVRLIPLSERKQVTVLFADMVKSTELVANLDPEQAMERLQPAMATLCEAVEKFDGTIVRTLGDGIMALFGAPRAQEGHALLACEAALTIQKAFPIREKLRVRVGLHSGEVVSDGPTANLTKELDAYGLTIHLARRLQEMAKSGAILLSEDCYRLVYAHCDVRVLGQHNIRGVPIPINVYHLRGLKTVAASRQFLGTRLTSFRGRDEEIITLQHAIHTIEDIGTKVIGIVGPPGTGKSRLCHEFAKWCRSLLIPVFVVRAQLYGHATPLQPVLELFRLLFGVSSNDESPVARSRIAERLKKIGPKFDADIPVICEFLGIPPAGPSPQLQSKARRARLLEVIRGLVRHNGKTTGVIIIEDLHWLDEASEEFVAALVETVADIRTLLVVNCRPPYAARWMNLSYYGEITLGELSRPVTDSLVEELIGNNLGLRDVRHRVAERSGGNPFFAEELVRSLAEGGVLLGDFGNYAPGAETESNSLPSTVQAVIADRIDHLDKLERIVLQVGAIIGKEIPLAVLELVADTPPEELEAALARLCQAKMFQEQTASNGRWYAFRHPLIQEVAYGTQLKVRRNILHASVASAMEHYYCGRRDEFAGLLAYHYEAAGKLIDAARCESRAAMWVGSTNSAEAIKHWKKVRTLLRNEPRSRENDELRILASGQISWLGWREGLTAEEAKPFIQEALTWAKEIDNAMVPMLMFVEARITGASGGAADIYVRRIREALALLKPGRDVGRAATLNASLCQAYGWAGLLEEALTANDVALQGVSSIDKFDHQFLGYSVEHWIKSLRGRILIQLGRLVEAEEFLQMMLFASEESLMDPTVEFIAHLGYVEIAWCRDDPLLARQHATRVAELAERHGSPYLRVFAIACSGMAKYIARDFVGALSDFFDSLAFLRHAKAAVDFEPEIMASLAECYFAAGRYEQAVTTAKETIKLAKRRTARLPECRASITYGCSLIAQHGTSGADRAKKFFRSAEKLIEVSGARIYSPLLAQGRAHLLALTSRSPNQEGKFV